MIVTHHNPQVARVVSALERAACEPRRTPRGWQARCPGHEDRHPSLAVAIGRDGRVLIRCWSGCTTVRVLDALGLRWSDLFADSRRCRR
jgi:hypothetical protein